LKDDLKRALLLLLLLLLFFVVVLIVVKIVVNIVSVTRGPLLYYKRFVHSLEEGRQEKGKTTT